MAAAAVNRVYIGNLPEGSREDELHKHFSHCGPIVEITVKRFFAFIDFERRDDMHYCIERYNNTRFLHQRITVEVAKGIKRDTSQAYYDAPNHAPRRRSPPASYQNDSGAAGGGSGGYGSNSGANANASYSRNPSSSAANYSNSYSHRPSKLESRKLSYRVMVLNLPKSAQWGQLKDFMKQAGEVNYVSCNDIIAKVGIVEFEHSRDIKNCIKMLNNTEFLGKTIYIIDPEAYCKSMQQNGTGGEPHKTPNLDSRDQQDEGSYHSVEEFSKSHSSKSGRSENRSISQDSRDPLPDHMDREHQSSRSPVENQVVKSERNASKESQRTPISKRSYRSDDGDDDAIASVSKEQKLSD
ncbi:MAG: Serine/arginine-rich splicing factor 6 [Marteilia pararefringens]